MTTKTRQQREADLLRAVQTESGRTELRDYLKNLLGLQLSEQLPQGTLLIQDVLDAEFGPEDAK
jgi:hypothetical protein